MHNEAQAATVGYAGLHGDNVEAKGTRGYSAGLVRFAHSPCARVPVRPSVHPGLGDVQATATWYYLSGNDGGDSCADGRHPQPLILPRKRPQHTPAGLSGICTRPLCPWYIRTNALFPGRDKIE